MRAALKGIHLEPDPSTLPDDPSRFCLLAQLLVGPADGPGKESFDVTICTPEWLAAACREAGGVYNPRHHLVADRGSFDQRALRAWLEARVEEVEADDWTELANRLGRIGHWESEDYRP